MSAALATDPLAPIRAIFERRGHTPHDRELANIAYLVELARNAPVEITHGIVHHDLAGAIRVILTALPGMIAAADDEAAAAKESGRTTDMDTFVRRARALLEAATPFEPMTQRRNPRGAWHGWARSLSHEVRSILRPCSFAKPTAPAILVIVDLLALAEIETTPTAVVEALRERDRVGNKE